MKTFTQFILKNKIIESNGSDIVTNIWDTDTFSSLASSGIDVSKSAYYYIKYKLAKSKLKTLLDKEFDGAKNIIELEISKLASSKISNSTNDIYTKLNSEKSKLSEELDDVNDDFKFETNTEEKEKLKIQRDLLKKKILEINKKLSLADEHKEQSNKIENLSSAQIDDKIEELKNNITILIKETDKIIEKNPLSQRFVAKERLNNTILISRIMLDSKVKISEEEKNSIEEKIKEAKEKQIEIENQLNSVINQNTEPESSVESDIKELPTEILKLFTIIGNLKTISNDEIIKYKKQLEILIEKNKDNKSVVQSELIKNFNEIIKSKNSKKTPNKKKSDKDNLKVFNLNKKITAISTDLEILDKEFESNMNIIKNPNSISDPEIAVKLNDIKKRNEEIKLEINSKENELQKLQDELSLLIS